MSRFCRIVTFFVIIGSIIAIESRASELRFVSVVFRHGDRAPDDDDRELYPNDPYLHCNFFPMGRGGLTNSGKKREFAIGETLRTRYGDFLGDVYHLEDIHARSTDVPRTKMSLSLVLAGLYPPAKSQSWHPELKWQPIPMTYLPMALDVLLIPHKCPRYLKELERVQSLPEVEEQIEKLRPLMENLTTYTGKLINNTNQIYFLYHTLMAEHSMNLKLPDWTESLFPFGPIYDGAVLEYKIASYNDMLKRLNGGTLLKRMSDDMVATVKNRTKIARKMNLFSAHESNIVALLQTLGVYEPHVPEYSSAIFMELISEDEDHYVKVLYYLGIPSTVVTVKIPGCQELCPLDDFLQLLENVTPTNEELDCLRDF